MRHPSPARHPEIRARLLGRPKPPSIRCSGNSAVYAWWVTGKDVRGRRLGQADSLEAVVEFLRRAIERPGDAAWRPAAARVYQRPRHRWLPRVPPPCSPSWTGHSPGCPWRSCFRLPTRSHRARPTASSTGLPPRCSPPWPGPGRRTDGNGPCSPSAIPGGDRPAGGRISDPTTRAGTGDQSPVRRGGGKCPPRPVSRHRGRSAGRAKGDHGSVAGARAGALPIPALCDPCAGERPRTGPEPPGPGRWHVGPSSDPAP